MAEGPAVEVAGLVKRYGDTVALDSMDLQVPRGSVLGVLGPNGAGKTTVVRILATLLRQDAGSARVCGLDTTKDAHRVRQLIGLTGQDASVDGELTGAQNLQLVGRLLGLSRAQARRRAAELLDEAGLGDAAGRTARTYSGGMRRRLDLAASLVHRPAVVFLDEPTTGLDPARPGRHLGDGAVRRRRGLHRAAHHAVPGGGGPAGRRRRRDRRRPGRRPGHPRPAQATARSTGAGRAGHRSQPAGGGRRTTPEPVPPAVPTARNAARRAS